MSFGAFQDGRLVSYALGQDDEISTHVEIELTHNVEQLIKTIISLKEKGVVCDKGYCFHMIYLATDHEFEGKGLCTECFNMSCKAAIQKGFKKYTVNAFHPGTKRITEKYFKQTQIVGEKLLDNQEKVYKMTAMF